MTKYNVDILETLCRAVELEAESLGEAIDTVTRMYKDEEIILDSGDFVDVEFSGFEVPVK